RPLSPRATCSLSWVLPPMRQPNYNPQAARRPSLHRRGRVMSMLRRFLALSRPFGVALGIFIALNLFLAIQKPSLSASRIWLYLQIPEPLLSAIAGVLGLALFWPRGQTSGPG